MSRQENFTADSLTLEVLPPEAPLPPAWAELVDGVVVINLKENDRRLAHARRELDERGGELQAKHVTVLRRARDPASFTRGCAGSHRAALAWAWTRGWRRVMVIEDDLALPRPGALDVRVMLQRVSAFDLHDPQWLRYMLGSIPLALEATATGCARGVVLGTTCYIASRRYMRLMIDRPFVDGRCADKSAACVFGNGFDHEQSVLLSSRTYVEWPARVLVDPVAGQDNTHHGNLWSLGIGFGAQRLIQHAHWLVTVLACVAGAALLLLRGQDSSLAAGAGVALLVLGLCARPLLLAALTDVLDAMDADAEVTTAATVYLDEHTGSDYATGLVKCDAVKTPARAEELYESGLLGSDVTSYTVLRL